MDMKYVHILGVSAVMAAALILAAREAGAQDRPVGGVARNNIPGNMRGMGNAGLNGDGLHRGFHHGFGNGVWVIERDPVVIEREVIREVPVAVPAAEPAPAPREPYVIGKSYASLPGGCMKLIDEGVSYYLCSGEWYQQVGTGRSSQYKAVARAAF